MQTRSLLAKSIVSATAAVTFYAAPVSAQCGLFSSGTTLDFSAPRPGTLLDRNGVGTGFTTRLDGTGSTFGATDPQLELDESSGALRLTSTRSDLNGQQTLDQGVYPGMRLSSFGFTGAQDFCVSARFTDVSYERFFDQFGIYVGGTSTSVIRAGYLFTGIGRTAFSVWTLGNFDQGLLLEAGPDQGSSIDIVISRTAGIFTMQAGGFDLSSMLGAAELNALSDLTVGVFAANAFNDVPQIGTLTEFMVGVDAVPVPEPSALALLLVALAAGVGFRVTRQSRAGHPAAHAAAAGARGFRAGGTDPPQPGGPAWTPRRYPASSSPSSPPSFPGREPASAWPRCAAFSRKPAGSWRWRARSAWGRHSAAI